LIGRDHHDLDIRPVLYRRSGGRGRRAEGGNGGQYSEDQRHQAAHRAIHTVRAKVVVKQSQLLRKVFKPL
jgi:hypothetical protein